MAAFKRLLNGLQTASSVTRLFFYLGKKLLFMYEHVPPKPPIVLVLRSQYFFHKYLIFETIER